MCSRELSVLLSDGHKDYIDFAYCAMQEENATPESSVDECVRPSSSVSAVY